MDRGTNAFLQGFMQGFHKTGGTQKLSSWAGRNIADGEHYNPRNDPQFIKEYKRAAQSNSPDIQKQFMDKYGDYLSGSTRTDMFGAQPTYVNPKEMMQSVNPDQDYSYIPSNAQMRLEKAKSILGTAPGLYDLERGQMQSEVNLNQAKAGTEGARQDWYGAKEFKQRQHGNIYSEEAKTERQLRPQKVNKVKAEINQIDSRTDLNNQERQNLKQELINQENLTNAEINQIQAETAQIQTETGIMDQGQVNVENYLSSQDIPGSEAFSGVSIPAQDIGNLPLQEMATLTLEREKLNSEINNIEADTSLTQQEKQNLIAEKQNQKDKVDAEIEKLKSQAGAQNALANKRNAQADINDIKAQIQQQKKKDIQAGEGNATYDAGNVLNRLGLPPEYASKFKGQPMTLDQIEQLTDMYYTSNIKGRNSNDQSISEKRRITTAPDGTPIYGNINEIAVKKNGEPYFGPNGNQYYVKEGFGGQKTLEPVQFNIQDVITQDTGEESSSENTSDDSFINSVINKAKNFYNNNKIGNNNNQGNIAGLYDTSNINQNNNNQTNNQSNNQSSTQYTVNDITSGLISKYGSVSDAKRFLQESSSNQDFARNFESNYGVSINEVMQELNRLQE